MKTQFRVGIALRYTWEARNTPVTCPYGKEFGLTHALHCTNGGYTHLRHNEIRDVFANLIDDVCHNVQIEPKHQSLDGENFSSNSTTTDDDPRLDIKTNGLWGSRFNSTFFDVKVSTLMRKTVLEPQNMHTNITRASSEISTKREFTKPNTAASTHWFLLARVALDVYETTRNNSELATARWAFMKQLAAKISEKRGEPYTDTISYI